jgi:hypothetical protein
MKSRRVGCVVASHTRKKPVDEAPGTGRAAASQRSSWIACRMARELACGDGYTRMLDARPISIQNDLVP